MQGLKERGYEVVPVSELMGKTRADVMPPLSTNERWAAWIDSLSFSLFGLVRSFIIFVFFVGDMLMSGRLVLDRRAGDLRSLPPSQGRPSIRTISRASLC